MKPWTLLLMGLLSFLFGCDGGDYRKKSGTWYFDDVPVRVPAGETLTPLNKRFAKSASGAFYRASAIADADAPTFTALSEHYAKDRNHVYYCDTYRVSQDYFSSQRIRIDVVKQADPAGFSYMSSEYGRDGKGVFFEGVQFAVKDVPSFELLDYGFARDRVTGYYHQKPVPGSDGASFRMVDNHYAKDAAHVFFSDLEPAPPGRSPHTTVVLAGALPESFVSLESQYGADAKQVYYRGKVLTDAVKTFKVLNLGYAKSATQVYYMGKPVQGADAASFGMLERVTDTADAEDARGTYQQGQKSKSESAPK